VRVTGNRRYVGRRRGLKGWGQGAEHLGERLGIVKWGQRDWWQMIWHSEHGRTETVRQKDFGGEELSCWNLRVKGWGQRDWETGDRGTRDREEGTGDGLRRGSWGQCPWIQTTGDRGMGETNGSQRWGQHTHAEWLKHIPAA